MENLFSAFVARRSSCNNGHNSSNGVHISSPLCISKKRKRQKGTSFGSRSSTSSNCTSNSDLISVVDAQLMQIKEKLAEFRDQDTQFRERMDSLNESVSEITSSRSSLSSFTPSECSDLVSLDEAYEEEEKFKHQIAAKQSKGLQRTKLAKCGRNHFNRPRVRNHDIRRATSYPSSLYGHIELPEEEEETMEAQRYSTYSADQAINLYPHYDNPEEISTLF